MSIQELAAEQRQDDEQYPVVFASKFDKRTFGGLFPNRETGT
jgi:hypothetical protein